MQTPGFMNNGTSTETERSVRHSWLREPLVHFLALGALLFLLFQWRGEGGSNRIVVPAGQVAAMAASFQRTWMRPPTADELKGLVDDWVREELAVREATAQGLDEGDQIIRRRLRQKLEFFVEDEAASTEPTEDELRAWLVDHAADYRRDPVIGFRQVYVSVDRRGGRARADAEAILRDLQTGADPALAGDPTMLPPDVPPSRVTDIGRVFGEQFAAQLPDLAVDRWVGPIESGLGLHLVHITTHEPGGEPTLATVRTEVRRDLLNARRIAQIDSMYARLARRYRISIELPGPDTP